MKIEKIYIGLIVILVLFEIGLTGYVLINNDDASKNEDSDVVSKEEVELKYKNMKEKLIEYGKLIYENDEYINAQSKKMLFFMNLRNLSLEKGYDISMFIDPLNGEQCDLNKSGIQFIIRDVSNLDNVIYEFNPLLVCGEDSSELIYGNNNDKLSDKLYEYLIDYLPNIYDENSGVVEPFTYNVTLNEFQEKGYDISMFINNDTGNQCDLEETYIKFEVLVTPEGERRYNYNMFVNCDG